MRAVVRAGLRPCLKLLMTFDALLVKCIRPSGHLRILDLVFIVAVQAAFRLGTVISRRLMALTAGNQCAVVFAGMMVAVKAGCPVAGCIAVGVMIEKDFAGIGLVHDPNRFFGRLGGKASSSSII